MIYEEGGSVIQLRRLWYVAEVGYTKTGVITGPLKFWALNTTLRGQRKGEVCGASARLNIIGLKY